MTRARSRTAVAPLERLKILMQVQGKERVYRGVVQVRRPSLVVLLSPGQAARRMHSPVMHLWAQCGKGDLLCVSPCCSWKGCEACAEASWRAPCGVARWLVLGQPYLHGAWSERQAFNKLSPSGVAATAESVDALSVSPGPAGLKHECVPHRGSYTCTGRRGSHPCLKVRPALYALNGNIMHVAWYRLDSACDKSFGAKSKHGCNAPVRPGRSCNTH